MEDKIVPYSPLGSNFSVAPFGSTGVSGQVTSLPSNVGLMQRILFIEQKLYSVDQIREVSLTRVYGFENEFLLKFPLKVTVVMDKDRYIVRSADMDIFGTGGSEEEAMEDFAKEMVTDYKMLNSQEKLGHSLSNLLDFYKSILVANAD